MELSGFEPEAFRMQSERDTTTPQSLRVLTKRFVQRSEMLDPSISKGVSAGLFEVLCHGAHNHEEDLRCARLTGVGFEPTPLRTGA